jgi:hypothetical protein
MTVFYHYVEFDRFWLTNDWKTERWPDTWRIRQDHCPGICKSMEQHLVPLFPYLWIVYFS